MAKLSNSESVLIGVLAVLLGLIALFAWFIASFFFVAIVVAVLWDHYYALEDMKERISMLEEKLAQGTTGTPDSAPSPSS